MLLFDPHGILTNRCVGVWLNVSACDGSVIVRFHLSLSYFLITRSARDILRMPSMGAVEQLVSCSVQTLLILT